MFGNPTAERAALEMTYEDTMTITTTTHVVIDHITHTEPKTIYADVMCALSRSGDSSAQTDVQHKIDYDAVIFAAPELAVLPGDTIQLRRFGRDQPESKITLDYEVIGVPAVYMTHQQIKVKERGIA